MTIREIPLDALIGDVVRWSEKLFGQARIHFVSGRWLVLIDLPSGHSATAYERAEAL